MGTCQAKRKYNEGADGSILQTFIYSAWNMRRNSMQNQYNKAALLRCTRLLFNGNTKSCYELKPMWLHQGSAEFIVPHLSLSPLSFISSQ